MSERKPTDVSEFDSFFVESWTAWDRCDTFAIVLYNAILNRDMGSYKKGDKVNFVADFERCKIRVYGSDEDDEVCEFTWSPKLHQDYM